MSTPPDIDDSQEAIATNQPSPDSVFDPGAHFGGWLQAVESFRNREAAEELPGAYLENGKRHFEDVLSFYDHVEDKISSRGTLVVTEHGKLQADVEVTTAVIDGIFKGKITATKSVLLENHALVIGEIHTPTLAIRGGAIIEGTCHFDVPKLERWGPPGWEALKVGFAKVWRGRIFQ